MARSSFGDVKERRVFRWTPASPYAFSKGAQERRMGTEY